MIPLVLRFGSRLTMAMLLASSIPVGLAGFGAFRSAELTLHTHAVERQTATAESLARALDEALLDEFARVRGAPSGPGERKSEASSSPFDGDVAVGPSQWSSSGSKPSTTEVLLTEPERATELDGTRWLEKHLAPWSSPGREIMVTDAQGRVLADLPARTGHLGASRDAELRRGGGRATDPAHPDRERVSSASAPMRAARWHVVVLEPLDHALLPLQVLERHLKVWGLLALICGASLAIFLARGLLRPFEGLLEGLRSLERGVLVHGMSGADREDEFGELARAFNAMVEDLERWGREFDSRAEEQRLKLERVQTLLCRAQKLAAVGQLGAGVAHEINNPLAAVLGLAEVLAARAPEGSKDRTQLDKLRVQAERIREIVQRLSELASQDEAGQMTAVVDPRAALEMSLAALESRLASRNIRVVRDYDESLPNVVGDAERLTQAFGQLLSNAERAMAKTGGTLTVRARATGATLITVVIEDTGEGIPEGLKERIFEPFFTTKRDWSAKGLGLPMVNKTVAEHHGQLTVESEHGRGAAFTVTLPAATPSALP